MPKKIINKSYYNPDDQSNNIRKVSFKNGSGRIRKFNNRVGQLVLRYMNDDDVDMDGSERQHHWKLKHKNFKRRSGSPGIRGPYSVNSIRPNSDWYQIRILYGAKYGKTPIVQLLLKHIAPKVFIPNSFATNGKDASFYIDDYEIAMALKNLNKKIQHSDGYLMDIQVREGIPPSIHVNEKVKEQIKLIMAKRYVAENKALDLSKFASDPDFQGEMYCPLARHQIMKAVCQIISENISDIVALNLSDNRISNFDDTLSVELRKLKNLKILHLAKNRIKSVHALNCFKHCGISELVLKENPLASLFKEKTHYVSDVRKKFPKLTKLDDMDLPAVISFDVVEDVKLPTPQAAFMCSPEGRGIVKAFLSQYFALYDSDNRLELAQAYHDNSSFSLSAYYSANQKPGTGKLTVYMQESRNLFKVFDYPRRKSKLQTGKQKVVQFLTQLPKTQHDLSSFVVDLTLFTPALLNLTVNGVFREPTTTTVASLWPIRHFCRTFLIVPVNQGFCIINDMLMVTNATQNEIENSFKEETQSATVLQSPSSQPVPGGVGAIPPVVQATPLDESVRLQMVQTLASRTGMNLEWSKKCLDETEWDFERAIWTFTELQAKGSIPAEAFVK